MGLVQRCARPMVVHNEIIEKELEAVEGTQYVTRESILRRAQEIKGIPLRNVDKTGRLATGKGAIGTVIEESWFGYMRTPLCKISSTGEIEQRFRLN